MYFDEKANEKKNIWVKTFVSLPKSSVITASGISTLFSTKSARELCERLKLLLQEKQTENKSDIINEEYNSNT